MAACSHLHGIHGGVLPGAAGAFEKRKKALPSLALSSGEVKGEAFGAAFAALPLGEPCKRLDGVFPSFR
jgi:hypothetical protein